MPPRLTSSQEQVATGNVEVPPHSRGVNGTKVPSFAPPQSESSCERVTTDDAEAPHHRCAIGAN